MKYPVFSIKDNKVGFLAPQVDQTEQSAIRGFSSAINNNDIMKYSPNDFDLYKIGEFDSEKGILSGMIPELMVSGNSVYTEK